ncbi:MAG TPA: DpnI domain-containing protein [Solirubrobacterales bacterium]|nr:DpnI domain-containing protein [Solirubrobacterales bacterium]
MATKHQILGAKGEAAVSRQVPCPRCNRPRHLARLQRNFQCADLICKFCGFLAQVKTTKIEFDQLPRRIPGAAWGPQHDQIIAGIFHGLYIVGYRKNRLIRIDYVPAHVLEATPQVFEPRAPLKSTAKRAGWQGFTYNLEKLPEIGVKRVYP